MAGLPGKKHQLQLTSRKNKNSVSQSLKNAPKILWNIFGIFQEARWPSWGNWLGNKGRSAVAVALRGIFGGPKSKWNFAASWNKQDFCDGWPPTNRAMASNLRAMAFVDVFLKNSLRLVHLSCKTCESRYVNSCNFFKVSRIFL